MGQLSPCDFRALFSSGPVRRSDGGGFHFRPNGGVHFLRSASATGAREALEESCFLLPYMECVLSRFFPVFHAFFKGRRNPGGVCLGGVRDTSRLRRLSRLRPMTARSANPECPFLPARGGHSPKKLFASLVMSLGNWGDLEGIFEVTPVIPDLFFLGPVFGRFSCVPQRKAEPWRRVFGVIQADALRFPHGPRELFSLSSVRPLETGPLPKSRKGHPCPVLTSFPKRCSVLPGLASTTWADERFF